MSLVERTSRDDTVILAFRRPPANALDLDLTDAFRAAVEDLAQAPPVGGVVVTGHGAMFSGGVDFKAAPAYAPAQRARMIDNINAMITAFYGLPTATVAALNGHAIGGALVIALACDVRIAAEGGSQFGLTEVTAGIPYPACPMEIVREEIEPSLRRRLVLGGDVFGAQAALAHGLIDEIVAPESLLDRATALARSRSAARGYARVKTQLRAPAIARMQAIIASGSDPMLKAWL